MKKEEIIKDILNMSEIHHNTRFNFSKMPESELIPSEEQEAILWREVEFAYDDLKEEMKEKEMLGEIYSCGRMGATLYWDEYWSESQGHLGSFKYYEEELQDMSVSDLKEIQKELQQFHDLVEKGLQQFYVTLKHAYKEEEENIKEEQKEEKLYQKTLKVVQDNKFIKRLVQDTL